jgi:hypothetical protein
MRNLPNINTLEEAIPTLKVWQQTLNQVVSSPPPPRTPFNFQAQEGATGVTGIALSWELVRGADGYEIQMSTTGDFSTASIIATLTSAVANTYFDNTISTSVKRYYRIRATAGTANSPHSVKGIWSAPISQTSGSGTTTQWKSRKNATSSAIDLALDPAYQQIIGLGKTAVPLILRELRNEVDHWFWALRAITREDPVPPEIRGKMRSMAACWLEWGRATRMGPR